MSKEETIEIEREKHRQKLEFLGKQEEFANAEHNRKMERLTKIESIALMQKFDLKTGE